MPEPLVIAVVPAKLTSVRIPYKNLAPIEGLELFAYSIRAAQRAKSIAAVFVSSESRQLLDRAVALGAEPVLRPSVLSGSDVTNQAVLDHVLDHLRAQSRATPDIIVLLQPTHPFRVPADIDAAVAELWLDDRASSVFALREEPGLLGTLSHARFVPDVVLPRVRLQEAPKFFNTGAFYLLNVARTLARGSFFGDCIRGYRLSRPELEIDVDEPIDLVLARAMASHFRGDLESLGLLEPRE